MNNTQVGIIIFSSIVLLLATFFIGEKTGENQIKETLVNQGFADWLSDDSKNPYWKINIKHE